MTGWIEDQPIAHRGLHGDGVPENSLAAIEKAVHAGYAVEVDIRLSADGVPVVFHDETLERMTGQAGLLAAVPSHSLQELELHGTPHRIPRLDEVLDTVDGRAPLLIELKNYGEPGELEPAIRDELAAYPGAFAVQSFNPRSVGWFARHEPDWPRGQIAGSFQGIEIALWKKTLLRRLMLNGLSRPTFLAYEHAELPYWPVTLHRRLGLPVLAWTVRSKKAHRRVQPYADNVIFERYRPEVPSKATS